jgi:hypothetical protein
MRIDRYFVKNSYFLYENFVINLVNQTKTENVLQKANNQHIIFFLFFFPFSLNVKAQNVDYEKLSLNELEESFAQIHDNPTGEKVCNIFIRKAKKENNIEALFRAYKLAAFFTKTLKT